MKNALEITDLKKRYTDGTEALIVALLGANVYFLRQGLGLKQ